MKIENIAHTKLTKYAEFLNPSAAVLDIKTSGRYWRTSSILEIHLVFTMGSAVREWILIQEKEEDEYDMLLRLTDRISEEKFVSFITFNGNAFDLPHLRHKYAAYGLADPFDGKTFRDLFLEYKEYQKLLAIPSRRLSDYAGYLNCPEDLSDAAKTLVLLSLDSLTSLFDGNWSLIKAVREDDYLYYTLSVTKPFIRRISLQDQIYHIILDQNTARLSAKITDGRLRRYYTDYKNYYYLPMEGYAIHKSMASFVEKSHKEKAVRTNCFSLVSYSDRFLKDTNLITSYISSVLQYLHSR